MKSELTYVRLNYSFDKYHKENPHIYKTFCQVTFETINKGFKNYSANGVFEVMRWQRGETGNDEYKVNNNYRAFYARKFMEEHPQHSGFFRIRKSVAD